MMADVLEAIVAASRTSAVERERVVGRAALERALADARRPDGAAFEQALRTGPGARIIAECKRRSPSKGILRHAYAPETIARAYELAGAAAISVLTEPTFFDGALAHLSAVRRVVAIPIVRKDFIVTPYQVVEAAHAGADAVLLIVAALEQAALVELSQLARALGLAALVEVHDREELRRAVDADARVIGVNCRNLRTLAVDRDLFGSLAPHLPSDRPVVAESGLSSADQLARLTSAGYRAFLMGERFMTDPDPGEGLRALRRTYQELVP